MNLTLADVQGLLRRAQLSLQRGYQVALGDHYAQELGGTDGSPAGLVTLCKSALESNGGETAAPGELEPAIDGPASAGPDDDGTWPPGSIEPGSAPVTLQEPVAEPLPDPPAETGSEPIAEAEAFSPEAITGIEEEPLEGDDAEKAPPRRPKKKK